MLMQGCRSALLLALFLCHHSSGYRISPHSLYAAATRRQPRTTGDDLMKLFGEGESFVKTPVYTGPVDLNTVGQEIAIPHAEPGCTKIVMKFGGSSLASAERIMYVSRLIQKHVQAGYRPVVVCSAIGKTTNTLLSAGEFALKGQVFVDTLRTIHVSIANDLGLPANTEDQIQDILLDLEKLLEGIKYIGEMTPRTLDSLVSFGERLSIRIIAANLNKLGIPSQALDSWTVGLETTSEFGNAEINEASYAVVKETLGKMDNLIVPVITGFIAQDSKGRITTLGRGGSDLSATAIGSAITADEIQVWKDVDGIMTADPRLIKNAKPVEIITYEEAAELAFFGAEVLHPIAMQPAMKCGVPVRVKNSYNPAAVGTVIQATRDKKNTLVTALTSKKKVQLIDIVSTRMLGQFGFLSKVFATFEANAVSVDVVASSDVSLSMTLDNKQIKDNIDHLLRELKQFAEVQIFEDRSIVSMICNVERSNEVMAMAFSVMAEHNIDVEMLSQGASKVNISMVVKEEDREKLLLALHDKFFPPDK